MPRRPASAQIDTLEDIRTAAFSLFGRFGYDGVSIGDIARDAGLSKGALYWHFSGKSELFLDCLRRMHRIFESTIFEPMQAEDDAVQRVLALFQGMSRLLQDPRVVEGIGGYWLGANHSDLETAQCVQRAFERRTADTIRAALELGMAQGTLDLEGDMEDMSRAIIAIVEAIVLPLRHQTPDEVHRILAVLARTLFRAYATSDEVIALSRRF